MVSEQDMETPINPEAPEDSTVAQEEKAPHEQEQEQETNGASNVEEPLEEAKAGTNVGLPLEEKEKIEHLAESPTSPPLNEVDSPEEKEKTVESPLEEQEKLSPLPESPPLSPVDEKTTTDNAVGGSTNNQAAPKRPPLHRGDTQLAQKKPRAFDHIGITFGLPMIVLFDIVVPCIIYYTWYDTKFSHWKHECSPYHSRGQHCPHPRPEFDKDILGSAIASFGIGELYILIARVWRLFYRREDCAPLLSRNRWELDATSWVYLVAMICALVPFTVGSALEITELYLYGPAFLMAFLGVLMVITTLHPFKIPIGINSHARGSGLRPFIYYAAEDFIAVDGLQDREFRVRYNERYETNKAFRQLFVYLTLWWELGVLIYIGALSAVIWTLPFHYAFGLSLGILFGYIVVWAAVTYVWVQIEMSRENKALAESLGEV